ncbi:hypothetical protein Tco_0446430 [Tanacetum coccineum]
MVVHNQEEIGEASAIPTDPHHTPTFIQPSPQPQKIQKPRRPKKKDTQVPQSSVPSDNVVDEVVYKELDDSLVKAATTTSSLEAKQDNGSGPRRQETMGDTIAQTRFENVSKISNDLLLARALAALKSVKPKVKANVVEEPSVPVSAASTKVSATTTTTTATIPTPRKGIIITELGTSTTTTISSQPSQAKVQDKGKGIMVEEPMKSIKKKDLVRLDEEIASKLQVKFDEEERLAR